MSEDALRRSWDENARAWTDCVREGWLESRRMVTDGAVVKAVLARSPRRVLDVGSGEGWLARALAERGVVVVGFDGSRELVERAREAGGGEFHVATYGEFGASPRAMGEAFDAVVCNFSLLGEAIEEVLAACATVLGDDGRLVVQTLHPLTAGGPYRDGWREEAFAGLGFPSTMPWYFRTLGSWTRTLGRAGLLLWEIREPTHPGSGEPASLILIARPRPVGSGR